MDKLAEVVGRLDRVRFPSDISFERGGRALVAAIRPAGRAANESYQSRIWRYTLDGGATQLTHGPNGDYSPRCSPVDDCIAFASDRTVRNKADLFILDRGTARPLGTIPGTIEDIQWTRDSSALIVLAADRGLDGGATNGAIRIWWGGTEDPAITNPADARRRLFRVSATDGTTTEIGPRDATVWEFDLFGDDGAVALISADASERGWYHTKLAGIEFTTRAVKILHQSPWQLQGPAVSPSRRRLAFLEGWSSDRGLVAGEIRILELATGKIVSLAASEQSGISSIAWRDEESLWFAGWSGLGSTYGVVRLDGTFEHVAREDAVIGPNTFLAAISPIPDHAGFVAIREAVGAPPEIVLKATPQSPWAPVTSLNSAIMADYADYPEVRELRWKGKDGLAMEALVLLPKDRKPGPLPAIVDIHGGPTWSAKHAFNPGFALHEAAAGYAVFLPNYRGNTGWGQPYSRLNIGDPGGAEFDDIMAGIDALVAEGIADADRLGVTGASYGGFMTAWAVARTNRFKAAVMVSGISNQWSCHYSCNHDFGEFIVGGPLKEERYRTLAIDRSPLFRLEKPATPTLIIHGELDRCTPLGQGQEFYSALLERGVPAELVVYPREGHGFQESAHKLDKARRVIAWFDCYLKAAR
jgi:dipeptidyl aminopeptidase/acylaminoacyl peptidase